MSSRFHERAMHALGRIRSNRRLTAHEVADYLALLDLASRPPTCAPAIAERAGFTPGRVGVVLCDSTTSLSEALGLGRNSVTLERRIDRYAELGLAARAHHAIILRPGGVVRLDDHRAFYEDDAYLEDGQPYPAVTLPMGKHPAIAGDLPGEQKSLWDGSWEDRGRSSEDHRTIYRDQKKKSGGGRAPATDEPEGLDELAELAADAAAVRADGVAYRVSVGARRHLAQMVRTHGIEACRTALRDIAPRYVIPHPIGWLGRVLAQAQADVPPDLLEEAVRDCVPPNAHGRRRQLAAAERAQLTALIAEHGRAKVQAALPAAAGCTLPVAKLRRDLSAERQPQAAARPGVDRAARERAVGGRAESAGGDARTPTGSRGWPSAPAASSDPEPAGEPAAPVKAPVEDAAAAEAWAERAPAVQARVSAEVWRQYFTALVAVGLRGAAPELAAADPFVSDWVATRYGGLLAELGVHLAGRLSPQEAFAQDMQDAGVGLSGASSGGPSRPPDPRPHPSPKAQLAMRRLAAWAA